ncbi:MAG TPA: hypothetical protein VL098_03800 [Flavipsychrobacter sp.]|nr:hypothetical protein [Flavipsychrobacter sp.]
MCRNYNRRYLLCFLFLFAGYSSFAQKSNRENSPYTRFGIGEFRNGANVSLRGMASISSAYSSEYAVNTDNPASYANLRLTTYEAGVEGSKRTIYSGGNSYPTGTVTLSYLTIGIPVGKHFGMALGLRPYTRTYYNSSDSVNMPGLGPSIRGYNGDGSSNFAFLGFAGKVKGFSAGINFGYLFGNMSHASTLVKQYDTVNSFNSVFSKNTRIGGLYYKGGLMYETALNKKFGLRLGATFSTSQSINAKLDEYQYIYNPYYSAGTQRDTAIKTEGAKGNIVLPSTYSFGAQLFSKDNWAVGLDFTTANWKEYRNFGSTDSVADRTYRVAVGGEFTPNPTSLYKYLNRVTYRLGLYYGKDYIELRNTQLDYYAVTLGASLPFKRTPDRFHFGMEIGKRGTQSNGLIRENFFKFMVGMSLNDRWFVKSKQY